MKIRTRPFKHGVAVGFATVLSVFFSSCSPDYKDISTPNGRQAVIDQANDYLTAGDCDEAITTLKPLYESKYVTNDVRMIYASAYGCLGGYSFTSMVSGLATSSSSIWSGLVKADYSSGRDDGHIAALKTAAEILRQTADPAGSLFAQSRGTDANVYMIFMQITIISQVIAPLGAADKSTGDRTQALSGATTTDQCDVAVAFATIQDSLSYVSVGSSISKLSSTLTSICASVPGGTCPTIKDPTVCTTTEQTQGAALLTAIQNMW